MKSRQEIVKCHVSRRMKGRAVNRMKTGRGAMKGILEVT